MQLIKKPLFNISLLLLLATGSCIEPFFPKNLDYEPMLFIQATVTDNPDIPHSVILSNTSPLANDDTGYIPMINVSGATVYIEKDDGSRYYFEEQNFYGGPGGRYYLPDPLFVLTEGSSYMLVVETSEGHRFESDFEAYYPPAQIDTIGYSYDIEQQTEISSLVEGYKFDISTTGTTGETEYFRWDLRETYRYMVPFQATHFWTGREIIDTFSYHLSFCYKDADVRGVYIGSTAGLSENRIIESPLHFVSQYGERLQIEYSLHTYQYHITQSAFQFWYDLRTLLYETGGLYETQPFRLKGNISCVSEPAVNVAGIFEVAGVSEKRIYVPRPTDFRVITERCIPDTVGTRSFPVENLSPNAWLMSLEENTYETAPASCFDCTIKGGYTSPPPFWEK